MDVKYKVDFEKKRPAKAQVVAYINNQFAAFRAGVFGATLEAIANQIGYGNFYLYQSEVKEMLENMPEKDRPAFVDFLKQIHNVREGSPKPFGGKAGAGRGEGSTTIDSEERAAEVANSPELVPQVIAIVKDMLALRKKLNPLINQKSECSIALKNKKLKVKGEVSEATAPPAEPVTASVQ